MSGKPQVCFAWSFSLHVAFHVLWPNIGQVCLQRACQLEQWSVTDKYLLTLKCWNNHALMMFVATLGNIPRFFCRFFGSSPLPSISLPSPEPILLSKQSPKTREQLVSKKQSASGNKTWMIFLKQCHSQSCFERRRLSMCLLSHTKCQWHRDKIELHGCVRYPRFNRHLTC